MRWIGLSLMSISLEIAALSCAPAHKSTNVDKVAGERSTSRQTTRSSSSTFEGMLTGDGNADELILRSVDPHLKRHQRAQYFLIFWKTHLIEGHRVSDVASLSAKLNLLLNSESIEDWTQASVLPGAAAVFRAHHLDCGVYKLKLPTLKEDSRDDYGICIVLDRHPETAELLHIMQGVQAADVRVVRVCESQSLP